MHRPVVFLSYHRESSGILARLIAGSLTAAGVEVFLDVDASQNAGPFPEQLEAHIQQSDLVVVILAQETLASAWVNHEIACAFELGKTLVPVFQEGYCPPDTGTLPPAVSHLLQCSGVKVFDRSNEYVDQALIQLLRIVGTDGAEGHRRGEAVDSQAGLLRYRQHLIEELNNNLVLEIYEREHYEDICITPLVIEPASDASTPVAMMELIDRHRLAVIGEPGSGKTTALRKLCLDLLRSESSQRLPVYVSLASFDLESQEIARDFGAFLDQEARLLGAASFGDLARAAGADLILALDGWDEIHDPLATSAVRHYLAESPFTAVITSRPEAQSTLPVSSRAVMAPLSETRVEEFLRLRLKTDDVVQRLLKWLNSRPDLKQLAENPLNLSLLAIIFEEEEQDLSRLKRTRLFERAFATILSQHHRLQRYGAGRSDQQFSRYDLETVLETVALNMSRAGRRFFSIHEFDRMASSVLPSPPKDLAGVASGTLGIIRDRRSGRLEFFHLWYQEFLAARRLVESSRSGADDLAIELADSRLAGLLPFVVGLIDDSRLSARLLRQVRIPDLFNYCRAIGEGQWNSTDLRELIERGIDHAQTQIPRVPVRVELAPAMAQIGSQAIEPFYSIARDNAESDYARRTAIEALALLPTDRAVDEQLLVELLQTDELGLLWHVVEQAGRIRSQSAREQLTRLLAHEDPIVVGDSLWALGRIAGHDEVGEPEEDLIRAVIACLDNADPHRQGHALRTLGRLRVLTAIPYLVEHLHSPSTGYRWIVPEAAGLIGGSGALDVIDLALSDQDTRVVAAGLKACAEIDSEFPDPLVEKIRGLVARTEWVSSIEQTLGSAAQSALKAAERRKEPATATRIFLARHCETEWTAEGRLQGSVDVPLSDNGRVHAQRLAKTLGAHPISRVYSSPYLRARQTAGFYADSLGVSVTVVPGMRELDHGAWEGRLLVELEADPEYQRWMRGPESTPIPGSVESATVAQQRAIEALRQVLGASSGEAVLVVAHKHVLALVMCALNGLPLSAFGDTVRDDFTPLELTIQQLERLRG